MGLLTDRINNKLERSNLINEHALNREPVPLTIVFTIKGDSKFPDGSKKSPANPVRDKVMTK